MAETLRVIRDYIGASEADQLAERINARCEAKERVITTARELINNFTYATEDLAACARDEIGFAALVNGGAYLRARAALAALDGLPPAWMDETAKVER